MTKLIDVSVILLYTLLISGYMILAFKRDKGIHEKQVKDAKSMNHLAMAWCELREDDEKRHRAEVNNLKEQLDSAHEIIKAQETEIERMRQILEVTKLIDLRRED